MASRPILRIAPWLILVAMAYVAGRWHASSPATKPDTVGSAATEVEPAAPETPAPETPPPAESAEARTERIVAEITALAVAAKSMPVPDAATYAFFENLSAEDIGAVLGYIDSMTPGNEQDVLFIMTIRRWAALDGAAAVKRTDRFPALGTRINARFAAYEAWGASDPRAALALAVNESAEDARVRAITSVIAGASTVDPGTAIELWLSTSEEFRNSEAGASAAAQIASGAFGTGRGDVIRAAVEGMPEGVLRMQLIDTLASEWGAHYPSETLDWLQTAIPDAEARTNAINGLFSSLVLKDPALAATWATQYPVDTQRTTFIAAAVQSWARYDIVAAETWVNEQPSGAYLDGAGYAMAVHFMARHKMPQSFSWIRRINMIEMRAELLGALGRTWANESPEDFKQFLDQTSLNRAEVEMLLSKIPPAS